MIEPRGGSQGPSGHDGTDESDPTLLGTSLRIQTLPFESKHHRTIFYLVLAVDRLSILIYIYAIGTNKDASPRTPASPGLNRVIFLGIDGNICSHAPSMAKSRAAERHVANKKTSLSVEHPVGFVAMSAMAQ